ncbi:MAG: hypothetical protein HZA46_02555 [Planctomycetales bacterium]|nr:hypothetical protein [Planctomycetales bacterium]
MLAHFAMRLVFGISLMLCLMPRDKVPSAFFRILMLVLLGLGVLGAAAEEHATSFYDAAESTVLRFARTMDVACASAAFLGSIIWTLERRRTGSLLLLVIAGISGARLIGPYFGFSAGLSPVLVIPTVASQLATAGSLGAAMTAMLLGHRYLTAPGMPLDPLTRLNWYLGGAVALRAVMSGWGLTLLSSQLDSSPHRTWLALRWLAGIIGPAIVVVMVRQILKYKNTQSATGVLFVGVILTFIGELTADLLFREVGVPL